MEKTFLLEYSCYEASKRIIRKQIDFVYNKFLTFQLDFSK